VFRESRESAEKIVVLGGGVAGLAVANLIRESASVTLVTRDDFNYYAGLPRYVMDSLPEKYVRVPLSGLGRLGVRLIRGEVETVDASERRVSVDGKKMGYDTLIVALGAEVVKGSHLWTLEGARLFAEDVSKFRGGTFVVAVDSLPYRCPPAPFDVASRFSKYFAAKGLSVKTVVLHPEREPLAKIDFSVYSAIKESLIAQGIEFKGGFQPFKVNTQKRTISSKKGESVSYDLLHLVPRHYSPKALLNSGIKFADGWPKLKKDFRAVGFDDVYIIGDLAAPCLGLPMAGFLALYEASRVASSLCERPSIVQDRAEAICPVDLGDESLIPFCDFTQKLEGSGAPVCSVFKANSDFMKAFREMLRSRFTSILAGFP
jgi:sulfide:quinone oxidoreductase